jgi:hypothetical protein
LEHAQAIIASAIILHNFLIKIKDPATFTDLVKEDEFQEISKKLDMGQTAPNQGQEKFRLRNHIIKNFF